MKNEKLYVVQFNDGSYWCGYNTFDPQIRKATIFKSLKYAKEAGERFKSSSPGKNSYKILEIEINVIKEFE